MQVPLCHPIRSLPLTQTALLWLGRRVEEKGDLELSEEEGQLLLPSARATTCAR